jgi:hypothetical protein
MPRVQADGVVRSRAGSARLAALIVATLAAANAYATNPWAEHPIPLLGPDDDVLSVAITTGFEYDQLTGHPFYVTYEVQDAVAQTHVLYLQRWDGSFWASPVELGENLVPVLSNPSIAASPGHVTVVAHEKVGLNGCTSLKEFDYDVATGDVNATRILDDGDETPGGTCEDTGHAHIVWSSVDSTYHTCWTRKEGGAAGDGVFCSKRATGALAWSAAEGVGTADRAQDHVTLAVGPTLGNRRVAYHDATTGINNDAHEVKLKMFRSGAWYDYDTFLVPDGTAVPQPGKQQRPFVALSSDGKMHVTWEDAPAVGGQVVKYVRCLNATANGCDADAEWEFNNVALSEIGILSAHFPHLAISAARTWISFEQWPGGGLKDVVVVNRCLSAPFTGAWTTEDPYPDDDLDEYTEEYGTPHIATRSLGNLYLAPAIQVGTVTLREVVNTARHEGVLYTRAEPPCN